MFLARVSRSYDAARPRRTGFAAVAVKTDSLEAKADRLVAKTDRLEAKTDGLAVQMRMLHEDVIARIALLQEGWSRPAKRRRKKE